MLGVKHYSEGKTGENNTMDFWVEFFVILYTSNNFKKGKNMSTISRSDSPYLRKKASIFSLQSSNVTESKSQSKMGG